MCVSVHACACVCVLVCACARVWEWERHRAQVWKTENGKTLLIAFIFSLFTKRKKDSWDQDTHAQKKSWLYSVLINRVNPTEMFSVLFLTEQEVKKTRHASLIDWITTNVHYINSFAALHFYIFLHLLASSFSIYYSVTPFKLKENVCSDESLGLVAPGSLKG